MTNAAVRQSADIPEHTAQPETAQPASQLRRVSDIAIAHAAALATHTVPGVSDLSRGLAALAATYGAREHVEGVVVRHPTPETIVLDIHVIISEAHCDKALADAAAATVEGNAQEIRILPAIASQIRAVVYDALRNMASPAPMQVDVLIDDLR